MKKIMFTSVVAILLMAAGNVNAKGAIASYLKGHISPINVRVSIAAAAGIQDSAAINAVNHFFDRFKSGATPEELSGLFDENAELSIPGDTKNVPWIGKRVGRKAIASSFRLLKANIKPLKLNFTDRLSKGDRVVLLGNLESQMIKNGKVMKSDFCIDIVVKNGLLTYYHILVDSFEVSNKAKL